MIKSSKVNMIDVSDFDDLVVKTYGRTYSFQQQDGCKERGTYSFSVPILGPCDFENDTIPEEVNGDEMGVSFKSWLERDPHQKLNSSDEWEREHGLNLFWKRNFYPSVDTVIDDLYKKGLIEEGDYCIDIDW